MPRWLHVFANFGLGGSPMRCIELIAQRGPDVEHDVIALDGRTEASARVAPGSRLRLVPAPPKQSFVRSARAFAGLLREQRPDLLLTYNWGAVEALLGARLARQRAVVHHEDGFGPEEAERRLARRNWARRLLLPAARAVVVPSRNLERIAFSEWKQPARRVRYLPNGVDLVRFAPRPGPRPEGKVTVGSVASFRGEKNQAMLLAAFARCREKERARLVLVGDGPQRAACEGLARELGIVGSCEFRGATTDTAPHYRDFDVFALSSKTEQMPLVVLEAMASGLPIASPAVGDVEQMVCERNRPFIVPFVTADALTVALDALVADAELRAEIGEANRARCAQLFEKRACYQRFLDVYAEASAST